VPSSSRVLIPEERTRTLGKDASRAKAAAQAAPQIPRDLFRQLFDSVATPALGWPKDKPLPDVEQYVARDLLHEVLREMGKPAN